MRCSWLASAAADNLNDGVKAKASDDETRHLFGSPENEMDRGYRLLEQHEYRLQSKSASNIPCTEFKEEEDVIKRDRNAHCALKS